MRNRCLYAVEHTGSLLNGMHAWARDERDCADAAHVAKALTGIAAMRPGVSQAYVGLADGGLRGVVGRAPRGA